MRRGGREVVAGSTGASPHDLRVRKRWSHVAFLCGKKHTDLELVILSDYQLFSAACWPRVKLPVQNSAVLAGLTEESSDF